MPRARVRIATEVKPGFLRNCRTPKRQSDITEWNQLPIRFWRTCSFTCSIPPRSIRAARCASLSGMPARMFSSISISRWERTSWSRSTSSRRDKKRFRRKLRTFTNGGMLDTSLRCFQSLSDGPRNAAPSFGFGFELLQSRLGQSIVFGAAVVFGLSPKRGNPTFFFHSVQGGKERTWFDNKSATCDLLDPARDSQSVHLAGDKGFQDQQIQSPLHEGRRSRAQEISPIDVL